MALGSAISSIYGSFTDGAVARGIEPAWKVLERWAKAHIRAKVEHPFQVIIQQLGFQNTRLGGMVKDHCEVNVLAKLMNLYIVCAYPLETE